MILFCCSIILIGVSGCGKKEVTPKTKGVKLNFTATYNSTKIKGIISVPAQGDTVITLEEPASLKGLNLKLNKETLSASFLGINTNVPLNALPDIAFCSIFNNIFRDVGEKGVKTKLTGKGYVIKGELEGRAYTLTLDKNYQPIKLEVPSIHFSANLSSK